MKRIVIDKDYLVPVKSNFDGTLIFNENNYEEMWYKIGEVILLPWDEVQDIRKYKRSLFQRNWLMFDATDEYTPEDFYTALGVSEYYPKGNTFKNLEEVIAMKPKEIATYLQETNNDYREALTSYAKRLYESGDPRMDSKTKVTALEKVLNVDFSEV